MMGGAIGNAVGILYGSSPRRGLVLLLASGCILLGLLRCYQAYWRPSDLTPFRIRDLFTTIFSAPRAPTKRQMWIEGLFGVAIGICVLAVFR